MKFLFAAALLVSVFSIPSYAQKMGGSPNVAPSATSGGGGSGSLTFGSKNFQTLPPAPQAQFSVVSASGSFADFTPSVFVPYDQAVNSGQAILSAKPKTVVDLANESRTAKTALTSHIFAQDSRGHLVVEPRE